VGIKKFLSTYYHHILLTISCIFYISIWVSPAFMWIFGFMAMLIPFVWIANFIWLVVLFFIQKEKLLYPLIGLVLGFRFVLSTFTFHFEQSPQPDDFTILSSNVRVFNVYAHLNKDFKESKAQIEWLENQSADVLSIQEFYHEPKSQLFNTKERLGKKKGYQMFTKAAVTNQIGAEFGLAIFSKFPILNSGEVPYKNKKKNLMIFADLKIKQKTVRIYNIHLASMHIDEQEIVDPDKVKQTYIKSFYRLKNGFIERANQVESLLEHIKQCPHPIVLTGDLNDLPYSYTYFKLLSVLENSFENAGSGFGFTYNSNKLFFLRIDNQFFSKNMGIRNFQVLRKSTFSDHFPLLGSYYLKD